MIAMSGSTLLLANTWRVVSNTRRENSLYKLLDSFSPQIMKLVTDYYNTLMNPPPSVFSRQPMNYPGMNYPGMNYPGETLSYTSEDDKDAK